MFFVTIATAGFCFSRVDPSRFEETQPLQPHTRFVARRMIFSFEFGAKEIALIIVCGIFIKMSILTSPCETLNYSCERRFNRLTQLQVAIDVTLEVRWFSPGVGKFLFTEQQHSTFNRFSVFVGHSVSANESVFGLPANCLHLTSPLCFGVFFKAY